MIARNSSARLAMGVILLLTFAVSPSFAAGNNALGNLSGAAEQAGAAAGAGSIADLVNINSASADMLAQIPGLGDQIGDAIAAYRDANGAFSQIQDLLKVDGIDAALLDKIKPFITI